MKSIDQQLHDDARRIRSRVSPQLAHRVQQALARESRSPDVPLLARQRWPRLAAGVAAGIAVIAAVLVWNGRVQPASPGPTTPLVADSNDARQSRVYLELLAAGTPAPEAELEVELQRLSADWNRIRSGVRRQLQPLLSGG